MKKVLTWIGIIAGSLILLLVIAGFVVSSLGKSKAAQVYEVSASLLSDAPSDSVSLANGAHLAQIHACAECHGNNMGGRIFADAPPFLAVASNLTSGEGGIGSSYTVQDWDRAIRYGVKPNGQAVFMIMPSKSYHYMNDEDTADLIAYLQSIPPVDNPLPTTELRTLGNVLTGAGAIDPAIAVHTSASRPEPVEPGATAAYGKYLSSITCIYCHGTDYAGGPPVEPGTPPAPGLINSGNWTADQFFDTMRTGVKPDGIPLNPQVMPWPAFKQMTDLELEAIHLYLNTLD